MRIEDDKRKVLFQKDDFSIIKDDGKYFFHCGTGWECGCEELSGDDIKNLILVLLSEQ